MIMLAAYGISDTEVLCDAILHVDALVLRGDYA